MKSKTIKKVLRNKFDDFLLSIDDKKVQELVAKNTIITGGCIASMLLQEKVNDFDIYFTNKETVLAVAHYYVAKFKKKVKAKFKDGREVNIKILETDDRVQIHIKSAGIASSNEKGDYQYFESRPPEEGEDYVETAVAAVTQQDETYIDQRADEKYEAVFLSANAITLSDKMQIVLRFYGDPDTIHQHYDYIHCTNYWMSKNNELVLKLPALEALMARELVYIGSKYPVCSMIRTRKFLKRGFSINAGQYLKMAFQISKLDLTNLEVLEDQLIGVDAAYFGQLITSLQEHEKAMKEKGEPFVLDFGYLATIIDKIF